MSKEYPCIYHKNGECKKYSGDGVTSYCVLGPCHDETPSNADRIRAMSDEELQEWLERHMDCFVCPNSLFCTRHGKDCEVLLKSWLRQPAEGGEQDATD